MLPPGVTIANDLVKHLYYRKLPQVYRDQDALQGLPLKRFLYTLFEGGSASALTDIKDVLNLVDPETCPEAFLPLLCNSFGLEYFEDIPTVYQRRFLANIGEIMKRRGTYSCVRFLVRVLTGLEVEMNYFREQESGERKLVLTLLADTLEQVEYVSQSVEVVERYIQTQIPYYIIPIVEFRVVSQGVHFKVYRANVISIHRSYDLRNGGI